MRLLAVVVPLLFFSNCGLRFLQVKSPLTVISLLTQIDAHNKSIKQLKASIDIKTRFFHEQADIVAKDPKFLYWSLRSFFGPPSLMVASNGEFITIYDFLGQSPHTYQKLTIENNGTFQVMDFAFHPQSIINIFLTKIPFEDALDVRVNQRECQIEVITELKTGWHQQSIFDHCQGQILETELRHDALAVKYHVKYSNFIQENGIYFPKNLVLYAKSRSRFAKFDIEMQQIEINGAPVSPEIFYLKSH